MFGSTVTKIDYEWIDYLKLILVESELKVKWFMFGCVCVKVSWMIILSVKLVLLESNQTC